MFRRRPAEFEVVEELGFEPGGGGEHLWLRIRKTGANTGWVAGRLVRHYGVRPAAVGFSGRKDRHAVTEQWLSVHLPARDAPLPAIEGVEVLETVRHGRKLRVGTHRANRFRLRLEVGAIDRDALSARLRRIAAEGVPNWFGPQRFGAEGSNLAGAWRWLVEGERPPGRGERSLWLSAARSLAFNRVLAARVAQGHWDRLLPGELVNLDGRSGFFVLDTPGAEEIERCRRLAVHPTGPLPGRRAAATGGAAREIEERALAGLAPLVAALAEARVDAARRPLRVAVRELALENDNGSLILAFRLDRGAFAISVLRELFEVTDATGAASAVPA